MTDLPPHVPTVKRVDAGDVVAFEPKSPFTSTAVWGLLVLALRGVLDALEAKGKLPVALRDATEHAAVEVLMWLTGLALAAYGRWTATRPLGGGLVKKMTVK